MMPWEYTEALQISANQSREENAASIWNQIPNANAKGSREVNQQINLDH
jgi:hypothetical protein